MGRLFRQNLFAFSSPRRHNVAMNSDITAFGAAFGMINSAISTAKNAVDIARASSNNDLKTAVSEVLDNILELKVQVTKLDEENRQFRELNRALEAEIRKRVSVTRKPEFGYYYQEGDASPLCPKCYEGDARRLCHLTHSEAIDLSMGRTCRQCGWISLEYRVKSSNDIPVAEPSAYTLSRGYGN